MKFLKLLTVGVFSLLLTITSAFADKLQVGFIYVGPVSDHGWTYMHDQGRQLIESELGDQVETVYV